MYILDTIYEDYNVVYESSVNQFWIFYLILIGVALAISLVFLISLMKVYQKANRSGISALIPVYNIWVLLEIVNMPKWNLVLFFIPFVNFYIYGKISYRLAKTFRKSDTFAIANIFVPFVLIPIMGFGDSEYIGINQEAMSGVSIAKDLPVNQEQQTTDSQINAIDPEQMVDISIGGGVYQKEYKSSLLNIEPKHGLTGFKVTEEQQPIINFEPPKEKTGVDVLNDVQFIAPSENAQSIEVNQNLNINEPNNNFNKSEESNMNNQQNQFNSFNNQGMGGQTSFTGGYTAIPNQNVISPEQMEVENNQVEEINTALFNPTQNTQIPDIIPTIEIPQVEQAPSFNPVPEINPVSVNDIQTTQNSNIIPTIEVPQVEQITPVTPVAPISSNMENTMIIPNMMSIPSTEVPEVEQAFNFNPVPNSIPFSDISSTQAQASPIEAPQVQETPNFNSERETVSIPTIDVPAMPIFKDLVPVQSNEIQSFNSIPEINSIPFSNISNTQDQAMTPSIEIPQVQETPNFNPESEAISIPFGDVPTMEKSHEEIPSFSPISEVTNVPFGEVQAMPIIEEMQVEKLPDTIQSITPITVNQSILPDSEIPEGGTSSGSSPFSSLNQNTEFAQCPSCGTKLKLGSHLCFMCGKPL